MKKILRLILLACLFLLLNPFMSFGQTTWAKRITFSIAGAGVIDTTYFSFPSVSGFAEISPSTTSQNPPDQSWWNGSHALVLRQTSGSLGDSLRVKFKPLDYDGSIIMNDSLVIGSITIAATGALVGTLNKPYVFTITGSFDPCFGVAMIFTQGDGGVASRTYVVEHVTNGSYYVRN